MKSFCAACVLLFFLNVVVSRPKSFESRADVTLQDVQTIIDGKETYMDEKLTLLEKRFSGDADPDVKNNVSTKVETFGKEVSEVSEDTYFHSVEVCRGNGPLSEDITRCSGNPMDFIDEKFSALFRRILKFEIESYSNLYEGSGDEEDSKTENLSDRKTITSKDMRIKIDDNNAILSSILISMNRLMDEFTKPDIKKDLKYEFDRRLLSFIFELGALTQDVYENASRLCSAVDFLPNEVVQCSQDPTKYIKRRFKQLYKNIQQYSEELLALTV